MTTTSSSLPKNGLIVGKFSPLHHGHQLCIEHALTRCQQLTILSWSNPEFPGCEQARRHDWLTRHYGHRARIVLLSPQETPANDAPDAIHRAFTAQILEKYQIPVDVVFTSESYGPGFAEALSAHFHRTIAHIYIDPKRRLVPCSGTTLRQTTEAPTHIDPDIWNDYHSARTLGPLGIDRADCYAAFLQHDHQTPSIVAHLSACLGAPGSLLDVGCGIGRLLSPLHTLGWQVQGIESDFSYARRAAATGHRVHSLRMENFVSEAQFQAILLINSPLLYLLHAQTRISTLARLLGMLAPQGKIFIDIPDFDWIEQHYLAPAPQSVEINKIKVVRTGSHHWDAEVWHHDETLTLFRRDENISSLQERFSFSRVTRAQLQHEVTQAGGQIIGTWNQWGGEPTLYQGPRILALVGRV